MGESFVASARFRPEPSAAETIALLKRTIAAVTDATCAYLPPDGISAHECLNRILAATDNPEINAVMIGDQNGTP